MLLYLKQAFCLIQSLLFIISSFSVYDSAFQPITLSGKELAENGITVSFAEAPKAAIILYKEVNR